jgi:hypothetical protein
LGLAEAASKSANQFTTIVEGQVEPTAKMVTDELEDLKQVEVLLETQRESYTTQVQSVFLKIKKLLGTFEAKIISSIQGQYSMAVQSCKRLSETLNETSNQVAKLIEQHQSMA